MTKNTLISTMMLVIVFFACKQSTNEEIGRAYRIQGDTVYVHKDGALSDHLVVVPVVKDSFTREIIVTGIVQGIPTQLAYIAPPFSGRVTKSHMTLGQKVKINTPLFEITSSDFTNAQKEFFQARSERDLALMDMKRKIDLIKNGVASQRELEEAESALNVAEKEYENASASIKIYQTDPETMTLGEPLIIRSPINGEVLKNNLVTGLYVNEETESIATIGNLSKVWVVAQVKERDIRYIHKNDQMLIHVLALPGEPIKGKVFHVDESIDEDTRSIKVLSVCDNKEGLLKMGMYATVHFLDNAVENIMIPTKALLQDDRDSYVFVQVAPHKFVKTPVDAEVLNDGKAIVTKGLTLGDLIISEGGYYLK